MAQASLQQDSCTYQEKLRRSIGPGMYMLNTPSNDCTGCGQDIPADPYYRFQSWGPNTCAPGSAVDDGSELRGLNYKSSKCSADNYLPGKYSANGACAVRGAPKDPRACAPPTEDTRLSNPPCTLRSTGWNRWEWLCWDPQERAIMPFEWNVNYRIVAKDNHVPCIPTPQEATNEVATASAEMPSIQTWTPPANCGASAPGNSFATTYRSCKEISQM
jgi:hypothetical protein